MNFQQARAHAPEDGGRFDNRRSQQAGATCTAWVWLTLYGAAVGGSLLFGPWKYHPDRPVVVAAPAVGEHSK